MSDYRGTLERELERLSPPRIPFDRLARRRERKRRDQRIRAGVVGLAIAVAVGWLGLNAIRLTRSAPADDPTPTVPRSGALAYGVDGDIYVAHPDGSNAVRIADGVPVDGADECGPAEHRAEYIVFGSAWSPDGRYLAYWDWGCP